MSTLHKSVARFIPTKLEFLSEKVSDASNDELIKHLLRAVTQDAEKYCDVRLYQRDFPIPEFINGNGSKTAYLRHASARVPITNYTMSLYSIDHSGTPTLIPAIDYEIDPTGYLYYRARVFTHGTRNYKVIYSPGWYVNTWETALLNDSNWPVPEDLEKAVREVAAWHYKQGFGDKGNSNLGRLSYSTPDNSVSFQMIISKFLPQHEATIKGYRRQARPG